MMKETTDRQHQPIKVWWRQYASRGAAARGGNSLQKTGWKIVYLSNGFLCVWKYYNKRMEPKDLRKFMSTAVQLALYGA